METVETAAFLITEKHHEAMRLTDEAFAARRLGEPDRARRFFEEALRNEREAAETADKAGMQEPTRSVLYRSAATLALDCGDFREAERLAARGLGGEPPEEVAVELRQLLSEIYRLWPLGEGVGSRESGVGVSG